MKTMQEKEQPRILFEEIRKITATLDSPQKEELQSLIERLAHVDISDMVNVDKENKRQEIIEALQEWQRCATRVLERLSIDNADPKIVPKIVPHEHAAKALRELRLLEHESAKRIMGKR